MNALGGILKYVDHSLRADIHPDCEALFVLMIGSHAYPEFARKDSDLDLIVVHDAPHVDERYLTKLDLARLGESDGRTMIEMRSFTLEQFERYALRCELAKQFAFIRGYQVLQNRCPDALDAVQLCIDRYWTDSYITYKALRDLDINIRVQGLRYQFTDCYNYLGDARIQGQASLVQLRMAEILKDFIGQMWMLQCAEQAKLLDLAFLQKEHQLLASIGLLRVFNEPRGARLIDYEKYAIPCEISDLVGSFNSEASTDCKSAFRRMDALFRLRFNIPLLLDESWPSGSILWHQV